MKKKKYIKDLERQLEAYQKAEPEVIGYTLTNELGKADLVFFAEPYTCYRLLTQRLEKGTE